MRHTAQLLAGIALLAACSEPIPTDTAALQPQDLANRTSPAFDDNAASLRTHLAALRRATARFHRFETATASGWSAQITPCMTDPGGAGGMGFHYGNLGLIDGSVSVDEPELLLYEPETNGKLRLVAVEYIIPYVFVPRSGAPPVLFGQQFKQNDTFQLWGLHAWVWSENPSGMFASWNPRVTCENASSASAMSH